MTAPIRQRIPLAASDARVIVRRGAARHDRAVAAAAVLPPKPRHAGCGPIPLPRLSAHDHDDVTVVRLHGELDPSGAAVLHAQLRDIRAAEEISQSAASGTASTEDLRLAMIHYRALLGEPANAGTEPAATEPEQLIAADAMTPRDGDVYAAVTRAKAAGDPVASRQHVNGSDAQEPTK
jgi:hypothetical protein